MRGAALPSILVISTVMVFMLLVLINTTDKLNSIAYNSINRLQNQYNIESALERLCYDSLFYIKRNTQPFVGDKNNIVRWYEKKFGLYKRLILSAEDVQREVIIGSRNGYKDTLSFWLSNNGRALSMSGFSNIDGRVFVSSLGVSYNQIRSEYFCFENIVISNI